MYMKLLLLIPIFSLSCAYHTTEYTDGFVTYNNTRMSLLRQGESRSNLVSDEFCIDNLTIDAEASGNAVALGGIAGLALGGPIGGLVGGGIPAVIDAIDNEDETEEIEQAQEVVEYISPCVVKERRIN